MNIKQVPCHPSNYTANSYPNKVGFVLHWSVTYNIEGIDAVFTKPNSGASAHYGIGENKQGVVEIHQYVEDKYYAWANSNTESNRKHISIEHVGGTLLSDGKTRKKPTQATHDMSAQFIAMKCKEYGIKKLERGVNIFKHNEVSDKPTQCSGSLDIDYITSQVNLILNSDEMSDNQKPVFDAKHPETMDAISWNQDLKQPIFSNCSDENMNRLMNNATFLVLMKRILTNLHQYIDMSAFTQKMLMNVDPKLLAKALQPYLNAGSVDVEDVTKKVTANIIDNLND